MKSELFAKILSAVAETTELSTEIILSQSKNRRMCGSACAVCAFLLQVWRSNLRH